MATQPARAYGAARGAQSTTPGRRFAVETAKAVAIAGVTLAIAASAGYVSLGRGAAAEATDEATPAVPVSAGPSRGGGLIALEPFVVNVGDQTPSAFLRASLSLTLNDAGRARALQANDIERAHLRAAVLEVLAGQSAPRLVTPDGRVELQKLIKERASKILKDATILDVLFTDFVVQY